MRNLRISSEPHTSPEEITLVREAIARHNAAATGDTFSSPLAIFLRDERDALMGGALGDIWEAGSSSLLSGWRSRPAATATVSDSCKPPKKRHGHTDAGACS